APPATASPSGRRCASWPWPGRGSPTESRRRRPQRGEDRREVFYRRWGVELDPHTLDEASLRGVLRIGDTEVRLAPWLDRRAEAIAARADAVGRPGPWAWAPLDHGRRRRGTGLAPGGAVTPCRGGAPRADPERRGVLPLRDAPAEVERSRRRDLPMNASV